MREPAVGDLDAFQRDFLARYFADSVEPILIPLAADAAHPFPFISNLGLNLAVLVTEPGRRNRRFVRIKVPANLSALFPWARELDCSFFRVTRGAKDDPWTGQVTDDDADLSPGAIIGMVTAELIARKYAEQHDSPHEPVTHPRLRNLDRTDSSAIFDEIRRGDILVHLPYHSFDTSVLELIQSAATDPAVLAITLTIYRTGRCSPIIAARRGKQVAVLVEVTARFDEEPNIGWGKELQQAGVHVAYSVERVKTHVKLALVVREEADGIRRYVHVGTGNYHEGTARLYEDLGLLSADPELAAHAAAVFNELTVGIPTPPGRLLVAPHDLRERFTALIRHEAEHARAGRPCVIRAATRLSRTSWTPSRARTRRTTARRGTAARRRLPPPAPGRGRGFAGCPTGLHRALRKPGRSALTPASPVQRDGVKETALSRRAASPVEVRSE